MKQIPLSKPILLSCASIRYAFDKEMENWDLYCIVKESHGDWLGFDIIASNITWGRADSRIILKKFVKDWEYLEKRDLPLLIGLVYKTKLFEKMLMGTYKAG